MTASALLVARRWTDADTERLVEWFVEDPTLWEYVPGPPLTRAELYEHQRTRLHQQQQGHALVLAVDKDGRLACQFTIFPRQGTEGACHFLVARWAKGHGIALIKEAIAEAQRRGVTRIVGVPSPLLPQHAYVRFMRRLGFTIKFYGEILHV